MRDQFTAELEQLRLQVEVMSVRVEQGLEQVLAALDVPWTDRTTEVELVDTEVDAMNVSLLERCYELMALEAPVASDLRLIVSVIRVLNELERISDHSVDVCRAAASAPAADGRIVDLLATMAGEVAERFRLARQAWGSLDLERAEELAAGSPLAEALHARLVHELLDLDAPDSLPIALAAANVGRSLERICDHTTVIGARIRYLVTGDPRHLAAEVR